MTQAPASNAAKAPAANGGSTATVCPHFHAGIELIGKRWTGAILSALTAGRLRFGELAECIPGVSDRLLSQRLRELEANGLVARSVEEGTPVRVSYELTEMGRDLEPAIAELEQWAQRWDLAG